MCQHVSTLHQSVSRKIIWAPGHVIPKLPKALDCREACDLRELARLRSIDFQRELGLPATGKKIERDD